MRFSATFDGVWKRVRVRMCGCTLAIVVAVVLCPWSAAQTRSDVQSSSASNLPDDPSVAAPPSESFIGAVGGAVRTVGEDEWHFIKAPLRRKALVWDALFLTATGVLIANDESVARQVQPSWHTTSLNISDAGAYGSAAIAGGIYITGLLVKNEHAQEAGIRTAEATVDSVLMYAAMKGIFQRQRPYMGQGDGKFFSGNWSSGSFPSGHSMFTWTIASTIAHQYHSIPLDILMYGIAGTVSTTRVTAHEHFPSDVFVGGVLGYLIGDYVSHKPESGFPIRSESKTQKVRDAVLEHVALGVE